MWKKLLSTVGIGAATVDTQLAAGSLQPGGLLKAEILVTGGEVPQEISGLELALMTRVEVESQDQEYLGNHVLQTWHIAQPFLLAARAQRMFAFEAYLHPETPITELSCSDNRTEVWLQTGLTIDLARDASDRELLRITPTPAMTAFLAAIASCGYQLISADVEQGYLQAGDFHSTSGCYQELEFRPVGFSQWPVKEIEVSFVPEVDRTHVLLEVDRAFRGDSYRTLTMYHRGLDVEELARHLKRLIG